MKWLWMLFIPTLALAQPFQFSQELDSIPLVVSGYQVPVPWTGGYTESAPAFADIDGDGIKDLFIGTQQGWIDYYHNVGSINNPNFSQPVFHYQNINVAGPVYGGRCDPVFVDIDADGDLDCFTSDIRGLVHFWRNQGTPQNAQFVKVTDSLDNIQVPGQAHLAFVDIDGDGDYDLFIGDNTGHIWFYRNVGTPQVFDFQLVTSNFGNIAVGEAASPCFCDIDGDGDYDLFIGNREGHIWFYRNDGTLQNPNLTYVTNNWLDIDVGDYASPEFADLDGDGDYDLFIGKDNDFTFNIPGALHYWRNDGTPQVPNFVQVTQSWLTFDAGVDLEPRLIDLDNDGKLDLIFQTNYYIGWMKNMGTNQSPAFQLQTYQLMGVPPGHMDLGDLYANGGPDLITDNGWGGTFTLWENVGWPNSVAFQPRSQWSFGDLVYGLSLGDVDGDGDLDLVAGAFNSQSGEELLLYYQNQGTPQRPNFVLVSQHFQGLVFAGPRSPELVDFDGDGRLDLLIYVCEGETIWYYRNIGTPTNMQLQLVSTNLLPDSLQVNVPCCGDIDGDGDPDIFVGTFDGGMRLYRNITQSPVPPNPKRPVGPPERQITILPNPGNSGTTISYVLSHPQHVNLSVYNILGSRLATLVDGLQQPGSHVTSWDATWRASGIYLVRLESLDFTATQKVVIAK